MGTPELISEILNDLSSLSGMVMGIFLFGSYAEGKEDNRSDIDICLVAGPEIDPKKLQYKAWSTVSSSAYDIRIFELLPLYLQIRIMATGLLIDSHNPMDLSEYLYSYWKKWDDERWYQTPIPGAPGGL
jgi:predicted nucleotidyltransferase